MPFVRLLRGEMTWKERSAINFALCSFIHGSHFNVILKTVFSLVVMVKGIKDSGNYNKHSNPAFKRTKKNLRILFCGEQRTSAPNHTIIIYDPINYLKSNFFNDFQNKLAQKFLMHYFPSPYPGFLWILTSPLLDWMTVVLLPLSQAVTHTLSMHDHAGLL